jgi:hypothetical protein
VRAERPEADAGDPLLASRDVRHTVRGDDGGGYLFVSGGVQRLAHIEFHRRHQGQDELAMDVAEAQIRLFRRERVEVISFVWDLYGRVGEPVLSSCVLVFGEGSQSSWT